jgi:branched-chain amino acid transport system ATP-binding protein
MPWEQLTPSAPSPPPVTTPVRTPPPKMSGGQPLGTLVGKNIVVDFGGVRAVDGVHGRVEPGHRVGIVGANGAGKTTFFNALSGFVPFEGKVTLGGEDITQWAPFARARAGIRRTFQQPRLADILTVEQNVICGYGHDAERRDRVDWLLERFGLTAFRGYPVAAVPFGVRRQVECIRALSRTPQILLLDEPVSGLEDEEAERLSSILIELQAVEGWALMVIEHDLKFITSIAQYLMVMENGRQLTQGLLHDVMQQEVVRRVYLGETVSV